MIRPIPGLRILCGPIALAACAAVVGCAPPAIRGGFDSPTPAARMYAIEHAARAGDVNAVQRIIEELDSDDTAVRMLAIGALERLTGETHGYHHYAPRIERRAAMARWIAVLESSDNDQLAPGGAYGTHAGIAATNSATRNSEIETRDSSPGGCDDG